jgi:hypothetical protein
MQDANAQELIKQGNYLFGKKGQLNHLHQEIALNFYVERADFTMTRNVGAEFSDHLLNSYPMLARRDLGNSFGSMLRKDNWFQIEVKREPDGEGKQWLEWATGVQRRAMYDRVAQFKRASKEGDMDFAAFGQCALTVELGANRDALLYRCWHLRDLAWCEGADGMIDTVHQKWKPTVRDLVRLFPKSVAPKVRERLEKEPYAEVNCRRVVMPSEGYDSYRGGRELPIESIYIDEDNNHIMEERPLTMTPWVIPRWATVSGSQYAYSPATVVALSDARMIQAMTLVLLDAGEKAASPPMLATKDAIRSDIDLRAGGITWVDAEYDERLGEVLRPLSVDKTGIPNGMNMSEEIRAMIGEAFYLNKLALPMQAGDMTATEVSQRVEEYIRQAAPLFEPLEDEYNGAICEQTFNILLANGAFGSEIPDSLRGQDVQFKFVSPLRKAVEREKGARFGETMNMLAAAVQMDPGAAADVDISQALRDALEGVGAPARWIRDEEDAGEERDRINKQQQMMQMAQTAATAAPAVTAAGAAGAAA